MARVRRKQQNNIQLALLNMARTAESGTQRERPSRTLGDLLLGQPGLHRDLGVQVVQTWNMHV